LRVWLRRNGFLVLAGILAAVSVASGRVRPTAIAGVEDWRLLLVLGALLISVAMVRDSHLFDQLVVAVIGRFSTARSLTFALVCLSGGLSAILTNDVALFVVIPLTVAAAKHSNFRVRNAVILEVVAANLIGCVSPLGNPQNLFLLHHFSVTPERFVAAIAPFGAVCFGLLSIAVMLLEPRRSIEHAALPPLPLRRATAALGTCGLVLVILEIGHLVPPAIPAVFAAVAGTWVLRRRVLESGLSIVALFFFVFIDMAALRSLPIAASWAAFSLVPRPRLYLSALCLSQIFSNVPTAVLLAPLSRGEFRTLLLGVSAGACGTPIASLANLLGWQIFVRESGEDPVFLRRFVGVNLVFLAAAGAAGLLLAR
jgi:Na+/H+ antiporter NhaD/arsenite permease-like protein